MSGRHETYMRIKLSVFVALPITDHMRTVPLLAALLLATIPPLHAGTISFTGDLRNATYLSCGDGCTLETGNTDADFAQFAAAQLDFNVPAPSTMQAITFSYGGGVNGDGSTIAHYGFQPYLSLFSASGDFLSSTYFGTTCPAGANTNPGSGLCFDVLLDGGLLEPGNYALTISAWANMSLAENIGSGTLPDGFVGLGFLDFGEDLHYAVDVILQDAAPSNATPEPGSLGLLCGGGLMLLTYRRKRR